MTNADLAANEIDMLLADDGILLPEFHKQSVSAIIHKHCPENVWVSGAPTELGAFWIDVGGTTTPQPRIVYRITEEEICTNHGLIELFAIVRHCRIHLPN